MAARQDDGPATGRTIVAKAVRQDETDMLLIVQVRAVHRPVANRAPTYVCRPRAQTLGLLEKAVGGRNWWRCVVPSFFLKIVRSVPELAVRFIKSLLNWQYLRDISKSSRAQQGQVMRYAISFKQVIAFTRGAGQWSPESPPRFKTTLPSVDEDQSFRKPMTIDGAEDNALFVLPVSVA